MASSVPSSSSSALMLVGGELDLSSVCTNESDRMILRNIVYTIWATNKHAGGDAVNCYLGYNARRIEGRGYVILAFFGPGYRIAMQDMQLLMDVCPLRVDSVFVREPVDDDFLLSCGRTAGPKREQASAVLCVGVLDMDQPVQITESEVVRVRKRSRGILFSSMFGSKQAPAAAAAASGAQRQGSGKG